MNLSTIVRSSCRRKILKTLFKKKELNVMKLVHAVNSTYNEVNRNLRILESEDLIAQKYIGRKRFISLNLKSKRTSAVFEILNLMEKNSLQFLVYAPAELYLK